ncbi:MAG: ATP-dependent DNA helicase RecG [Candidatus Saccharimonadales bacterium]
MQLTTPLGEVKGVGPKTEEVLRLAGLLTIGDIVSFLPRAYEDYTKSEKIADIVPGNVVVKGRISGITSRYVRRGLHVTQAVLSDDSGKVALTWFNQPYRATHLKLDGEWTVSGEFALSQRRYQIMNPSVRHSDELIEAGSTIIPIYRQAGGLKTAIIRALLEEIRPLITMLSDPLPRDIVTHGKVLSYADAMLALHFPENSQDVERGRARIAFQEMMELLYAAALNKADNDALPSRLIPFDQKKTKDFVDALPFMLTNDQRIAAWEIIKNFESSTPMNRLLQGDVGAGKTVVAGLAAVVAAHAGYQTAFMVPTDLLARQHAATLSKLLEPLGITVGLLVGATKKSAKVEIKTALKQGSLAVVVGTQALIQDSVGFHKLGFVVIDEQHRFGVKQRQMLLTKSDRMPHVLSMTATPIPRSLQLTVYGDLDISILRQKPAGRKEILTEVISPTGRTSLLSKIDQQITEGRQVYVVCPLIDGSHESELTSVTAEHARLSKTALKHRTIGLLHGKLSPQEKDDIMQAFLSRKIDVLVSTTVIEVGVDVPNATIMIIEGAERFGMAQLHQLRGRVGRGEHQSYCYLIPTETRQTTNARLRELAVSNDGFYLAEKDLELRGPGEIYGTAQHGELNLQVARLNDMTLVKKVREAISWSQANGINLLQYDSMKERVERYRRLTTLN